MKRIFILFTVVMTFSCQSTSPDSLQLEMVKLNAEVRKDLEALADGDWESYDRAFARINSAYLRNLDSFSEVERDLIEKEIGKYYALRSKWESYQLKGKLKGYLKEAEGFIEELSQ